MRYKVRGDGFSFRFRHNEPVYQCEATGELSAEESEIPQCSGCGHRYHREHQFRCEICQQWACGDCRVRVDDMDTHSGACECIALAAVEVAEAA